MTTTYEATKRALLEKWVIEKYTHVNKQYVAIDSESGVYICTIDAVFPELVAAKIVEDHNK